MKTGVLAGVLGLVGVLSVVAYAAPHGVAPAAGRCGGWGCCGVSAGAAGHGAWQAMTPADATVVAQGAGGDAQAHNPVSTHVTGGGLIWRHTPEGILMAADELGLSDVQKGRLMQIAERSRRDAEAVLTPQQQEAFMELAQVLPVCGCGHVVADTPTVSKHAAHGMCLCPHCVAGRRAAAGTLKH